MGMHACLCVWLNAYPLCKSGRPKAILRADGRQSRAATLVCRNWNASFSSNELQEFKHGRPYRR